MQTKPHGGYHGPPTIWDVPGTIDRLRELWLPPPPHELSAHAIAEILSHELQATVTKSMVLGKAHRLGLPSRSSPIRRASKPRQAAPVQTPIPIAPVQAPAPIAPVQARARRAEPPRPGHCTYPLGHPRTADFRYCDDAAWEGRSYCETHWRLTHTKRRDVDPPGASDPAAAAGWPGQYTYGAGIRRSDANA
jgi:hypothetical protein